MKVRLVRVTDTSATLKRLKNVSLLDSNIKLYKYADVGHVEKTLPANLLPSKKQISTRSIDLINSLRKSMKICCSIDIFDLYGAVEFYVCGEEIIRTILPPIIESIYDANTNSWNNVIVDGHSRIMSSKMLGCKISSFFINSVYLQHQYNTVNVDGGWDSVNMVDKCELERLTNKRCFNSVFPGMQLEGV